jgi:hypothetical protein
LEWELGVMAKRRPRIKCIVWFISIKT